jgi:hypothetical protein
MIDRWRPHIPELIRTGIGDAASDGIERRAELEARKARVFHNRTN